MSEKKGGRGSETAETGVRISVKIEGKTFGHAGAGALGFSDVVYMAMVGSFPFNSFLSGVLSCFGTAVLAVCLRIQVNKENKELKDVPPDRAFADSVLRRLLGPGVVGPPSFPAAASLRRCRFELRGLS
ncbi:hypothetical protein NL676_011579 [Syzygium grande]|nr:hypothetical protein NL676_011579 [Syzygium grande]